MFEQTETKLAYKLCIMWFIVLKNLKYYTVRSKTHCSAVIFIKQAEVTSK
jgi:hypothetical protein